MSEKPSTPDTDITQTSTGKTHLLAEGRVLAGRYRIGDVLGLGGMGMVYKAHDQTLNIDVALKVLRDNQDHNADERTLDRFHQELVLARQVSHRNVVRIHDLGHDGEIYFLTMDLVEGRSLKEIIEEQGKLSTARALDLTRQLALGLAAAHEMGVVHRDLKPANILVDEQNTPYITDFGVARSAASTGLTRTGHIVGTPDYLSPEQARGGELDGRSDIYSLGLILYEMLSGQLPFTGETYQEVLAQRTMGKPRDLAELGIAVPTSVRRIIEHCLARNPDDRYDNALQLAEDLGAGNATQVLLKRRGRLARYATVIAGVAIALIGLGLTASWLLSRTDPAASVAETAATSSTSAAIAILPLEDLTGRGELAWLRTGVPELVADQLAENQDLQLVDPNRVYQTLADLNMIDRSGTPGDLRQAAELLGAQKVVTGNIRTAGDLIRIDARITTLDAANAGEQTFAVEAAGVEEAFLLISRFGVALQETLAVPASREMREAELSGSESALRAYTEGVRQLYLGNSLEAAPLFEQAVQEDAGFAAGWLRLSEAYQMLGFGEKSVQAIQNASSLLADSSSKIALQARAREAILTGDLERAQTTLATIVERYPNDSEARVSLALAHEDEGELDQAMEVLRQVLADDPNHPRAWFLMGKYAILTGNIQVAIDEYLVRALIIQNRLGNQQGRADVLNAMGIAYYRMGQLSEAEENYRQAAEIRNRIGDQRGVASSRSNIARILVAKGDYDKARTEFEQAMASRESIGDRPGMAVLHNEIGLLEENLGQYQAALERFRQALQIRRQLGDKRALTESYGNVGFAYFTLGEYDNASVYWQQALDTAVEIGNQEDIVLARQNIGLLDFARGRWEAALKAFLETLEEARAMDSPVIQAVSKGNLGRLAMYQGRFDAAGRSLDEAINTLAQLEDIRGEVEYSLFKAELSMLLGLQDEAGKLLQRIAELTGAEGNREQIATLHRLRGEAALAKGDLDTAGENFATAMVRAQESGNPIIRVRAALAEIRAQLGSGSDSSARITDLLNDADRIGNLPLQLKALELAARAALRASAPELAERHCRQALRLIQSVGNYEGAWRVQWLLARALDRQGKNALAAPARERARDELLRLQQNMAETQWRSFSALPEVKELTDAP